jgi:predicted ester cyclase
MPHSAIAATTAGLTRSAGSEPAKRMRTLPPAWWSSSAAAIWLRPALWTQTNSTSGTSRTMAPRMRSMSERNKAVVRRLVDEVLNGGRLGLIEELHAPELAAAARRWIAPFRASFPDVYMEIVELIAEDDKVVGRFTCSATHLGEWLGLAATGRRFERVDEVSIFRFRDGRIVGVWSLEDTLGRLRQLGLAEGYRR